MLYRLTTQYCAISPLAKWCKRICSQNIAKTPQWTVPIFAPMLLQKRAQNWRQSTAMSLIFGNYILYSLGGKMKLGEIKFNLAIDDLVALLKGDFFQTIKVLDACLRIDRQSNRNTGGALIGLAHGRAAKNVFKLHRTAHSVVLAAQRM